MEELPPGYRFYPTEEELVSFYLHNKLEGKQVDTHRLIPVIDVYSKEPWDLPKFSGELCNGDREQWFFFTPRQQREAQGGRPNRTTASGYWKATGSPGYVYSSDNKVIGVKKTMVFYKDKAPTGRKTKWKMNVYRAIEVDNSTNTSASASTSTPKLRDEFSLCRVYVVSGSARAFDRRPLESVEAQQKISNSTEASTSLKTTMVDKASSSDETYSHSGELGDLPETSAGINSSNWEINEGFEEPLWEWEQLNFLYEAAHSQFLNMQQLD